MISEHELLQAISECEAAPCSYQNCEKLATFYTLYNSLFGGGNQKTNLVETVIGDLPFNNDISRAIDGKASKDVWAVISELFDAVAISNSHLYDAVLAKLKSL